MRPLRAPPAGPLRAAAVLASGVLVFLVVFNGSNEQADLIASGDARKAAARAILPIAQAITDQKADAAAGLNPATRVVRLGDEGLTPHVASLATDTGLPALGDADGGVIVIARYNPPNPTSVADRRATLSGFDVSPLDLSGVLAEETRAGAVLEVDNVDQVVAATEVRPTGDQVRFEIPFGDEIAPGWSLAATVDTGGHSVRAWLVLLVVVLVTVGPALLVLRRDRLERTQLERRRRRQHSDATLAELASVAQTSLDLAEVLPASFAVLESALDLGGGAVLTTGARPTFVWGEAPQEDEAAVSVLTTEAPAAAGTTMSVPLGRGGRSLGSMRVRLRRELQEVDLRTLAVAGEILSSAIANADAYAHQRSTLARMRQLDDLKTVFVATASHELRTPVAALSGYANMLAENWDDLDSRTGQLYATRIDTNARRLADLVEHLLDFSRLEQGGVYTADEHTLDLGAEVQELIGSSPHITPDHELLVSVEAEVFVAGSVLAIERVLTNLIGNAVKYSPAGTTIRVRVFGDHNAHLVVDDEGLGVPEVEREQIFSRFFRGTSDAVIRTRGAGLGLSIVTEFAASMGGVVSIGNAPSGGARFEITFPRQSGMLESDKPTDSERHEKISDQGDSDEPA